MVAVVVIVTGESSVCVLLVMVESQLPLLSVLQASVRPRPLLQAGLGLPAARSTSFQLWVL